MFFRKLHKSIKRLTRALNGHTSSNRFLARVIQDHVRESFYPTDAEVGVEIPDFVETPEDPEITATKQALRFAKIMEKLEKSGDLRRKKVEVLATSDGEGADRAAAAEEVAEYLRNRGFDVSPARIVEAASELGVEISDEVEKLGTRDEE